MSHLYNCKITNATLDLANKRVLFWGSVFSQWYKTPIYDPFHDKYFNCAEQGMMYYKAMIFGDHESAKAIMDTSDPGTQKSLGRSVKNYDDSIWIAHRYGVVVNINHLKFSQNEHLRNIIILLDGWQFVEASAVDKIWGVGLGIGDPRLDHEDQWLGQNLLGKAINDAQTMIIKEYLKV